jgi:integrase
MRGSTRKRGQTWTAYWDTVDPASGGRRQKSKGGFRTQREAQTHLATVITQSAEGGYVEPSKTPFGVFLTQEWLPAIRSTIRPLTHNNYTAIVNRYVVRRDVGSVPLRNVSPATLNALYNGLEQEGLSAGTRRLTHTVLRRALRDAKRWGKIKRNPAEDATPPAQPKSSAAAWTGRELRAFLEHVRQDRLYALWRLAATTGMRRGELLAVSWRTLELDGGRLQIDQQLIPTPGGCTLGPPKSKRSERTIALDPATVEALRAHREAQRLERDLACAAYDDHDLVFCDALGHPIYPSMLTAWFAKARKAAGIRTGTLHVLRHTAATLALTASPPVPLHIVAARLGDDPTTLLNTYAHLLPRSDAEAAEAVAAVLVDSPLTEGAENGSTERRASLLHGI